MKNAALIFIAVFSLLIAFSSCNRTGNNPRAVAVHATRGKKDASTFNLIQSMVFGTSYSTIMVSAGQSTTMFNKNIPHHFSVKGNINQANSTRNFVFNIGAITDNPTYISSSNNYQFQAKITGGPYMDSIYGGTSNFSLTVGLSSIYMGYMYVPNYIQLQSVDTPGGRNCVKIKWTNDPTDKLGVVIDVVSYDDNYNIVNRAYDLVDESNYSSYDISYLFAKLGTQNTFAVNLFRGNYDQFTDGSGNVYNLLVYSSANQFIKFN